MAHDTTLSNHRFRFPVRPALLLLCFLTGGVPGKAQMITYPITDPIAEELAAQNAEFSRQWADLADAYDALSDRVARSVAKVERTTHDLQDVQAKLDRHGLTPTVGLLLRHKKEQLDAWQIEDSQAGFVSQELQRCRDQQLALEMVRYDGSDPVKQTELILSEAGFDPTQMRHRSLEAQVGRLLRERHRRLLDLRKGYQDYQHKLGELDSATTASAQLTADYRRLIDRHIVWVRSGDPISLTDIKNIKGGMAALFDSDRSADFGPTLERKLTTNAAGGIVLAVWMILLLIVRWRCKSWLLQIGRRKRLRQATTRSRQLAAGVLTTLVALTLPAILYLIAGWLSGGIVSEATLHAAGAFYAAGLVGLAVEVPRQLLRDHGYLDQHVEVELPGRDRAAKYLTLVGFGLIVAAYTVTVMGLVDHGAWRDSISRFGFMFAMLVVAWTAHRSLRPGGGFLEPLIAKFGGSVIHRVRVLIYVLGLGFPLAMAALAALGYGFTADELTKRAIVTFVVSLIGWTLWAGVKTLSANAWQMLTGSTTPRREFDEFGPSAGEPDGDDAGVLGEHFLELKHHLAFLGQFALGGAALVCFAWLWIDMVPNARVGNPVVWTVQDTVTRSTVSASGGPTTESVVETIPVTALHLLSAAATLFIAFQLAKLLPALFDALVLQRVSFDEGMEHFSLVLGRCLLFGVGCFIACRWIGVRWQVIQWLAVGLTIGLGFGLQDMVRNLFGGLIVLFEKPARLGDLITIGKVTGRVAAQKLRTTVLADDDGREIIIPNKNFVSEDVVNWMGAGRLSVIPIEVAVTRDQRPADVCRSLYELVIDQPDVLLTPSPQATLVCVGKRSQRIEVRAWIEDGQNAPRFRDDLLRTVLKYLRSKNLLAADQPAQPGMRDPVDGLLDDPFGRSRKRTGRRTA